MPGARRIRAAVCTGALVSVALLAACNTIRGPTVAVPNTGTADGGVMVIGVVQEPTSFLAANIVDRMRFSVAVDAPVVEGLLWYRSTDQTMNARSLGDFYRPDLATEVPTIQNGDVKTSGCTAVTVEGKDTVPAMCVTWKLRPGVLWHDGSVFSSRDVCDTFKFFWLRYRNRNPTAIRSTAGWDQTIACREEGPSQATVSFRTTYGPYLSLGSGVYGILPARLLERAFATDTDLEKTPQTVDLSQGTGATAAFKGTDTLDRMIDGTGPFVLHRYEPSKDIVLVRNPRYWDPRHQPRLDAIVFRFVSDVRLQFDQASAGEINMGLDYGLTLLPRLNDLARHGRVRVETIPESGVEKIDLNLCANAGGLCGARSMKSPFTADSQVRHAMIKAINREQIAAVLGRAESTVSQHAWISLGVGYMKGTDVSTTRYDPAGARSLLDAAGYRLDPHCHDGRGRATASRQCLDMDFVTTSGNAPRARAQVAVQADLEAVGIFTKLRTVEAGRLFGSFDNGGTLSAHAFQMAMYANSLQGAAEPDTWYQAYHGDCAGRCPDENQIGSPANRGWDQNATGEDNPMVDRLLDEGRALIDPDLRALMYRQVEVLLAADLPEIPLYQRVVVNSYPARLRGLSRNDLAWTFNTYDWYCDDGVCQR